MTDLMIDLETLDTVATAKIVSIGAQPFHLERGELLPGGFYVVCDVNSQPNRTASNATLEWWAKQSPEARAVFNDPNQVTLEEALKRLRAFIGTHQPRVWSNGANFDQPILSHAYNQLGEREPWPFWGSRCMRTYRGLPGADKAEEPGNRLEHHALADATHHALWVMSIHHTVFGAKK